MTTETLDLISGVIEELIAAIPQIVVVLTTVLYSLRAIKDKVNTFPKITEQNQQKNSAENAETKKKVESMLQQSSAEFKNLFSAFADENDQKVGNTLKIMEKEIHDYKEQLKFNIDQTNIFLRQNKVLVDVLLDIVSKDAEKVSSGIAQKVSAKLNLAKEQLEKYPEILVSDIKVLENAMKETHTLIGKQEFEKLLKKIGYGKDN
jgi:hypothetical protein